MLKIGILGPFPPYRGGIATFNYHLFKHFQQRTEVFALNFITQYPAFVFPGKTQFDESAKPFKINSIRMFPPFRPWLWKGKRKELETLQLDVLIISWWTPLFAPSMWAFLRKCELKDKLICAICHNTVPHEHIPLLLFFQKRLFKYMKVFIVHWQGDAEALEKDFPEVVKKKLYHPIYDEFPSNSDINRYDAKKMLGIDPEKKVLLFFGLVRPYKGLDTLLKAFEILIKKRSDLFLVVAGEFYQNQNEFMPIIEPLLKRGFLEVRNEFIPNEEVYKYFKAADVVVLPYKSATQSGVIPLAYRWGRGVVTTNVGGLSEVVSHGKTGLLIDTQEPDDLAKSILAYFEKQEAIEGILPYYVEKFNFENYVQEMINVFNKFLD